MTKYIFVFLMITSSLIGYFLKPTKYLYHYNPPVVLEKIIPIEFAGWKSTNSTENLLITPGQKDVLNKIYSQTLSRTYQNSEGDKLMLSVAYGVKQDDYNSVHRPEICYTAQGFNINNHEYKNIKSQYGVIVVNQILASNNNRVEPITYWTTVGNKVVKNETEAKIEKMKYNLKGYIPDGLLFRVSNINSNSDDGFNKNQKFIKALIISLTADQRNIIAGL